ncbi:hypothetical protein KC951_03415 [Candidatus Saccharibacteria bacterium]|nr:hypothetical protein [Candidatus Saccharibacteria bacterium]
MDNNQPQNATQPADQPTPVTSTPVPSTDPEQDPGKGLAIAGIVLAFLFPLLGLVLSIIAHAKTKKAGLKTTLSTIGIVLSAVFMVLSTIFVIVIFLIAASGVQMAARDQQAQTDIDSLRQSIESYYETNGYYPNSLGNLDNADQDALTPPNGDYVYSYVPFPLGCNDTCSGYTLSVGLSNGEIYSADSSALLTN